MAQQVVEARVILKSLSNVVDDSTFHLVFEQRGSNTNVNFTSATNQILAFLNTVAAGATNAMCHYLSNVISRGANGCQIEYYDITAHLNGSAAGSPVNITNFTLGASGISHAPMPEQVAAIVEWRADYGSDVEFAPGARPRARDRNRFYLGPLNTQTLSYNTDESSYLGTAFLTDLLAAAYTLFHGPGGGPADITQVVQWSKRNAAVKPVYQCATRDRFVTQRRRSDLGLWHWELT